MFTSTMYPLKYLYDIKLVHVILYSTTINMTTYLFDCHVCLFDNIFVHHKQHSNYCDTQRTKSVDSTMVSLKVYYRYNIQHIMLFFNRYYPVVWISSCTLFLPISRWLSNKNRTIIYKPQNNVTCHAAVTSALNV
jgi:hypothetical protein